MKRAEPGRMAAVRRRSVQQPRDPLGEDLLLEVQLLVQRPSADPRAAAQGTEGDGAAEAPWLGSVSEGK